MAKHQELTELAGTDPYKYTASPDSMRGRSYMTNISRVLDNLITHAGYGLSQTPGQNVDESKIHELDQMINQHLDRRYQMYDPEGILPKLEYMYKPGPWDYPEPNEG